MKESGLRPQSRDDHARRGKGDVGSPNAIVRREIDGKVILRTGRRIPSVRPIGGVYAPISVVRMAVDDAYGAKEWREGSGDDEVAYRTEKISRGVCRAVSEFAFAHARRTHAKVFGGPKYTVSPIYEGMLKEEMDAAAARYPDVRYEPQLIDATYALLLSASGDALVVPSLNRDGDCLSDFVLAALRLDRRLGIAVALVRRELSDHAQSWPRRRTARRHRCTGKTWPIPWP